MTEYTVGSEVVDVTLEGPKVIIRVNDNEWSEFPIAAVDPVRRLSNQLVIFTPEYGETNGQNHWGVDVPVVDGKVDQGPLKGIADAPIPPNGYLLSGHGMADGGAEFLWEYAKAGLTVELYGVDLPELEPDPNEELKQLLADLKALVDRILEKLG